MVVADKDGNAGTTEASKVELWLLSMTEQFTEIPQKADEFEVPDLL